MVEYVYVILTFVC